jgi:hypothetical protein
MPLHSLLLIAGLALMALPAGAQPRPPADAAACRADEAALLQDMDVARARGRMLQRRQLAEQLEAVQARCGTRPATQSREESIERLQAEILEMRKELDRAETELRKLRQGL